MSEVRYECLSCRKTKKPDEMNDDFDYCKECFMPHSDGREGHNNIRESTQGEDDSSRRTK